jgi:hypothetical protein
VCGGAHENAERLCDACAAAVLAGDREALTARSIEFLSGRFGDCFEKQPNWYREVARAAVERTYFAASQKQAAG